MKFIPRSYQPPMLGHIFTVDRNALFAGMGTGKTVTCLTAINLLRKVGETDPVLVLAPKRVAQSTWPEESRKWSHLDEIEVSPIIGTPKQRAAALRRDASVFTTNYENLPWLIEYLGDTWPFRHIIADESTRLKSFRLRGGGKRARALAKVAHTHVDRWTNLTGTPSPNGMIDLWGQTWFLDAGQRLGRSFTGFTQRWFRTIPMGEFSKLEVMPYAQEQIQDKISDICLSIECDLPTHEPIRTTLFVDLPPRARRLYDAMENEMFFQLAAHEVEAFNAASKTIKCLQLANGAIYTDEAGHWEEIHSAKLEALDSVVQEAAGMPVLVAYHFKSDLARLQRAFPQGRVLDDDPQTITQWNKGHIPLLFAHPASAGHGLNLQDGGNTIVFFGHWWDLEQYQQIIERIGPIRQAQAGHDRPVYIIHIVARGTVDETVMARRDGKRSVQDLLMDAMTRRAA